MTEEIEPIPEYPSLGRRYKAMMLDGMITFAIVLVFGTLMGNADLPDWSRGLAALLAFFLYEPLLVSAGGTLGHRSTGIRVRHYSRPDKNISFPAALLRSLVKLGLGAVSFFTVIGNDQRRAIHDMASGSIVMFHPSK